MSIHFILPIFLSFFSGFLSLSQEILWTKLVGFLFFSTPKTFSFVLGCYLIGIALGSLIGKKICLEQRESLLISSGKLFITAAAIDTISIFAVAFISHDSPFCLIIITPAIIISAALRGADVGFGSGRSGTIPVSGGALGVVFDGRGRPLELPSDAVRRRELIKKWTWTLGGE